MLNICCLWFDFYKWINWLIDCWKIMYYLYFLIVYFIIDKSFDMRGF